MVVAGVAVLVAIMNRASGMRVFGFIAGAGVLLALLAHLRDHSFLIACWAMAVAALFGVRAGRPERIAGAVLVALALPWMLDMGPFGIDYLRDQESLAVRRAQNARYANTAFVDAISPEQETSDPAPIENFVDMDSLLSQLELNAAEKRVTGCVTLRERDDLSLKVVARKLDLKPSVLRSCPPPQEGESSAGTRTPGDELDEVAQSVEERGNALRDPVDTGPTEEEVAAQDVTADLAHLPLGLFVMLMEPVPWDSGGSLALRFARWEMILWYPALSLALIGLVAARRFLRQLLFPILFGGGLLLVAALTEGNIGTAYRHRGEFVWIVIVLAVVAGKWLVDRRTDRDAVAASSDAPAALETPRPGDATEGRKNPVGTP
jgi:hypothetical protein